jgi:hypothetical protein
MRGGLSAASASSTGYSASSVSSSSYVGSEDAAVLRRAGSLDRQAAVRSALNAGAIAAVLSLLPAVFIVALPLAGFRCVRQYHRRSSSSTVSPGAGFRLGALCGAFGFAIFTALTAVTTLAFRAQNEFRNEMIEDLRRALARNPSPQATQAFEYFNSPHGFVVFLIMLSIFTCLMFVVLSGLGGTISATLLRRKGPQA